MQYETQPAPNFFPIKLDVAISVKNQASVRKSVGKVCQNFFLMELVMSICPSENITTDIFSSEYPSQSILMEYQSVKISAWKFSDELFSPSQNAIDWSQLQFWTTKFWQSYSVTIFVGMQTFRRKFLKFPSQVGEFLVRRVVVSAN